ncbi:MAG: alpha/beta hydrolase [Actinomycetota bacterium]|nr:alpha/beta hydrolase [Actinomycetota bacterium]
MNRRMHAAQLLGDYPNALRFRVRAARDWAVPPSFAHGDRRPVVILPGIYESWHYLRPIAERLSAEGHPVHVITALGLNRAPIPDTAALVGQELRARGLRDVALVAHSKGGIVGKHLLARSDAEQRIDRLIAIASPFNGSAMAKWAPNRELRAFLPGDPVIAALLAETAVNARITSIYPSFDPHIPNGCVLEGARNVEVPVVGHFRILLQPELIEVVHAAVAREG